MLWNTMKPFLSTHSRCSKDSDMIKFLFACEALVSLTKKISPWLYDGEDFDKLANTLWYTGPRNCTDVSLMAGRSSRPDRGTENGKIRSTIDAFTRRRGGGSLCGEGVFGLNRKPSNSLFCLSTNNSIRKYSSRLVNSKYPLILEYNVR